METTVAQLLSKPTSLQLIGANGLSLNYHYLSFY